MGGVFEADGTPEEYNKVGVLAVAVEDLRIIIDEAVEHGGNVVLGGHSLGGSVTTAFATWDFDGHPGADRLDGLVYIDGITAPFAGLFNSTGSSAALLDPDADSLGQTSGLLPEDIVPPVPSTNQGQYGYALNVGTSPESLAAAQAHLGAGLDEDGGWDGTGAITSIDRFARMFSGDGINDADGTEWYFPQRLTLDTSVIANGNANPAQDALGVRSTLGNELPEDLFIYAFGASLGGKGVTITAQLLAEQSNIPDDHQTLVDRSDTYAHNDPAGAAPDNEFLNGLLPFLDQVASN